MLAASPPRYVGFPNAGIDETGFHSTPLCKEAVVGNRKQGLVLGHWRTICMDTDPHRLAEILGRQCGMLGYYRMVLQMFPKTLDLSRRAISPEPFFPKGEMVLGSVLESFHRTDGGMRPGLPIRAWKRKPGELRCFCRIPQGCHQVPVSVFFRDSFIPQHSMSPLLASSCRVLQSTIAGQMAFGPIPPQT